MNGDQKLLIAKLRDRLNLSEFDATDDEVLLLTKGTLARALAELDIASDNFGGVLRQEIKQTRARIHEDIRNFIMRFYNGR